MNFNSEWEGAAQKELGGKNPFETLTKKWYGYEILPYYTQGDLRFNTDVVPANAQIPFAGPNAWYNLPQVDASSSSGNSIALDQLKNGADGVVFIIKAAVDPTILLNAIKPAYCFLGFEIYNNQIAFFQSLSKLHNNIAGAVFSEPEDNLLALANLFKGHEDFRCFGIMANQPNPTDHLFSLVDKSVKILDTLTDYAYHPKTVFNKLAYTLHSTQDFFGDVIKVRALKILMNRIALGYGVSSNSVFIRMKVEPVVSDAFQPHGELIANSFSSIAAVASSVSALTVSSGNDSAGIPLQTARSISALLKEESRMDKATDPLAGSYFIESLTHSLVEEVWEKVKLNS